MAHIEIDTKSRVPIYEQIMDRIRALVRAGELPPGTVLPSVRQLASDLDINANTVAKAYAILERDGIVETARRRGTSIAATARDAAKTTTGDRLDRAIDRVLEEAASLGVAFDELLSTLERRRRPKRRSR